MSTLSLLFRSWAFLTLQPQTKVLPSRLAVVGEATQASIMASCQLQTLDATNFLSGKVLHPTDGWLRLSAIKTNLHRTSDDKNTNDASSSVFVSVFLLVLPLESLFHGLFHELGNSLGGTCVGYAVVIPTNFCSLDGQPMLLPPSQVHDLNERSTGMLNKIQRFFAYHFIETFGCDYSSSGVTKEALQAKITAFFELHTADGPRHDTYVVFYSGHSHRSGEWALAGGDSLHLDQILEWWRERNGSFCSRLIFVLDCDNSLPWVNEVQKVEGLYVAVQGATLMQVTDVEQQDPPQLGDFTSQWVEYNCNSNSNIQWSERGRAVLATYGISKYWSDYTLHLPTGSDVTNYWSMFFPRVTYPVVRLVAGGWLSESLNGLELCGRVLRYLKRLKLNWYPPATLDTGQGFKLVRSYKI